MGRPPILIDCLETSVVCDLAKVEPSTLDYWVRTGLVKPSLRPAPGHRRTRLWTIADAVHVRAIRDLRRAGCPLQVIRRAQAYIASQLEALGPTTVLTWDGREIHAVAPDGRIEATVRQPFQQAFLFVALPIGVYHEETERRKQFIRRDQRRYAPPSASPEAARQRKSKAVGAGRR